TASSLRARWIPRRRRASFTRPTSASRSPTSSSACGGSATPRKPSVLELWQAEGAFETLEAWLADELAGDGGAGGYLGYGLSETLRRERWPSPPEPCRLPLLAGRRRSRTQERCPTPVRVGEWKPSWTPEAYAAAVEEVRAAIARGDVYQVNLVQHLSAPYEGSPAALAAAITTRLPRQSRPSASDY